MQFETTRLTEDGQTTVGFRVSLILSDRIYELYLLGQWPFIVLTRFI